MKGVFVNCPSRECKKMLAKNVTLRPGDGLQMRCFNCGLLVDIRAEVGKITVKLLKERESLTDDEEDGIIFIHS